MCVLSEGVSYRGDAVVVQQCESAGQGVEEKPRGTYEVPLTSLRAGPTEPFNGFWPTPANYATPGIRSRCTTSEHSKTSTPQGGNNNPNGPYGWPHAATRPSSSAAPATKASTTADARHGKHDKHWRAGCPEIGHVRLYVPRMVMLRMGLEDRVFPVERVSGW
jgi:hypothetical protein